MASYSLLIHRALDFAAIAHRHQFRKSPEADIPYVSHAAAVGWILQRAGQPDEVVVAGILHDVLEDTPTSPEELRRQFGDRVLALVQDVSEQDKSLPWEERKARYIAHLRQAPPEARVISAADKLHNLHSLGLSARQGGDPFARMKRGRDVQIGRYEAWFEAARDGWDHPLLSEVRAALDTLTQLTVAPDAASPVSPG